MKINGVTIDDTFAEAFGMSGARASSSPPTAPKWAHDLRDRS